VTTRVVENAPRRKVHEGLVINRVNEVGEEKFVEHG
jgi:hypothetical protein